MDIPVALNEQYRSVYHYREKQGGYIVEQVSSIAAFSMCSLSMVYF